MAKPIIFDILAVDEASPTFTKVGMAAQGMSTKVETAGSIASKGFLYAGVAAAALGVHAIKMAGNFDAAIVRLQTTAGESQNMLGMVSKGLLDMAGKVGYSAQELAVGMYTVESAGFHAAQGLQVMSASAKAARVEGADLTTVTNAVTSLLVDYHLKANQAAMVTNVLTAAVGHGKTTFQGMAAALPNVAAAAASAHIRMDELASAIATMTMHGTDAAKAGTYLRQVIGQMEAPTAKARMVMQGLGIDANHLGMTLSSGSGHGLADAIKMVDDAITKHMTPSGLVAIEQFRKSKNATTAYQKVLADLPPTFVTTFGALSNMVGGVKALQGFLQLGGPNLKTYRDNVAAVREQVALGGKDVAGFAAQQQTLNGKLNDASGAASALGVSIGQKLEPVTKVIVGDFTNLVGVLQQHDGAVTVAIEGTALLGGAMLVAKAATWAQATATAFLGGEEGLLAIKMTASALATGEFADAAAGASLAAGAMGGTLRLVGGAAGMGLLIAGTHTAAGSMSTLEMAAGGALSGAALGGFAGPIGAGIGAAIGGMAGATMGLARSTDHASTNAKVAIGSFTEFEATLNHVSGAVTGLTRVTEYQRLQSSGLLTLTRQLGLSDREAVNAAMGNTAAREKLTNALGNTTIGTKNQRDALIAETGVVRSATLAQLNQNVATAQGAHQLAVAKKALQDFIASPGNKKVSIDLGNSLAQINSLHDALASLLKLGGKSANSIPGGLGPLLTTPAKPGPKKPAAHHSATNAAFIATPAASVGPSHGTTLGARVALGFTTSVTDSARKSTVPLVETFTKTGKHLSDVFIDALATHIASTGKERLSTAISSINSLISAQTQKLSNLLAQRTSIVQGFMGMTSSAFSQNLANPAGVTSVSDLISYQQDQLTKALQAQADVAKLVGEGLSKALVMEMANSGATGLANMHALAMGPASAVLQLNSLDAQTSAALSGAGMQAGNDLYGSQIQAATRDRNTAIAIRNELEKWRRQEDKNTYVQLTIGGKTVQASLLELKRHNGNKPLGLA